jgi:hypothetical protein
MLTAIHDILPDKKGGTEHETRCKYTYNSQSPDFRSGDAPEETGDPMSGNDS